MGTQPDCSGPCGGVTRTFLRNMVRSVYDAFGNWSSESRYPQRMDSPADTYPFAVDGHRRATCRPDGCRSGRWHAASAWVLLPGRRCSSHRQSGCIVRVPRQQTAFRSGRDAYAAFRCIAAGCLAGPDRGSEQPLRPADPCTCYDLGRRAGAAHNNPAWPRRHCPCFHCLGLQPAAALC